MAYPGSPYPGAPGPGGPQFPQYQYSDWITRVGASLIDAVPIIVIGIVFGIIESIVGSVAFDIFMSFILFVVIIGYSVWNRWIQGGQGQTIGKRMMNIKLISEETGQPIGTMNAFVRDICHFVDGIICDIGYLFPLWDPKRQTLADKIMKTVVIPA
ncbi:MAG TPA: RDD family protein [Streptosporangiaceae bacterium]|nr:RDD family protein [Streptosporangiaceae bacterium]